MKGEEGTTAKQQYLADLVALEIKELIIDLGGGLFINLAYGGNGGYCPSRLDERKRNLRNEILQSMAPYIPADTTSDTVMEMREDAENLVRAYKKYVRTRQGSRKPPVKGPAPVKACVDEVVACASAIGLTQHRRVNGVGLYKDITLKAIRGPGAQYTHIDAGHSPRYALFSQYINLSRTDYICRLALTQRAKANNFPDKAQPS